LSTSIRVVIVAGAQDKTSSSVVGPCGLQVASPLAHVWLDSQSHTMLAGRRKLHEGSRGASVVSGRPSASTSNSMGVQLLSLLLQAIKCSVIDELPIGTDHQ
jgi:hypothetical protein